MKYGKISNLQKEHTVIVNTYYFNQESGLIYLLLKYGNKKKFRVHLLSNM